MMTDKTLIVTILVHYGKITIKPECEMSKKFAKLLKQKVLTKEDVQVIKELGYEIKTLEVKL